MRHTLAGATAPFGTWTRRQLLVGSAALAAFPAVADGVQSAEATNGAGPIVQPGASTPEAFMERALEMKRHAVESGDQAYGAVIVKDGRVVGEAPSRVVVHGDPTAHAETEAIRDAARRLSTRDLSGCVMYSSSRPCPMCEAAAYWARIARLHHGAAVTDGGQPRLRSC